MTTGKEGHLVGKRGALLVGLVLVAVNLRPAVTSVSPVLEAIRQDLGLGRAAAGLLTTIPVLCMGVFALVAPVVGERAGAGRGILWAVGLVGAATTLRLAAGAGVPVLFAATLLVGAGVALAQALVPAVVKERFPDRTALVTGLYTFGMYAGAAVAAGTTAPLRHTLGDSWPMALGLWGLLAVPALALWWPHARNAGGAGDAARADAGRTAAALPASLPWRSGRAWLLALFFAGTSCIFWSILTWLAPLYQDKGFGEGQAGLLLTAFSLAQAVSALVVPALADRIPRSGDRRPWLALALASSVAGCLAVALAPLVAPYAWAALLGLGVGALFPLALILPLDEAPDPAAAGRLSAMTFFFGYSLAALAPPAVGAMRDAGGGFELPFLTLAVLGLVMLVASVRFRKRGAQP